ncbi:hypothetical protein ACR77J_07355 [Tissierella praeacuta]|uniref:hypothetical protein n=1 Tax=Tissierella praeacuta TaxID=43131 RepID=UPI003DA6A000
MNREDLLELLKTGIVGVDREYGEKEGRVIAQRILEMDENELREAVVQYIYER